MTDTVRMTDEAYINVRPTIRVDGEDNSDLTVALSAFVANSPLNGMAHAELTLTNWGTRGESGIPGYVFQDIGFGKDVDILIGEAEPTVIFSGQITAVEERYGRDREPQLVLLLQDGLHLLARKRNNRVFEELAVGDIVHSIAGEYGLSAEVNMPPVVATYHQLNESDLAFLMRLVGGFGLALRLEDGRLLARPEEPDPEPLELNAQDSLLQVRLLADVNHQAQRIIVKGFNPDSSREVSEEADSLSRPPAGITAAEVLDELSWPGEDIVPRPFPRSQGEAEAFADAHFQFRAQQFLSGDILSIGETSMKSGREILLTGVSSRFSGTWQVVHCSHRFDGSDSGYTTHLKIHRPDGQR